MARGDEVQTQTSAIAVYQAMLLQGQELPYSLVCPRCLVEPIGYPALSRTTRDDNTLDVSVCSPCGQAEAMQDFFDGGATPQSQWPVR